MDPCRIRDTFMLLGAISELGLRMALWSEAPINVDSSLGPLGECSRIAQTHPDRRCLPVTDNRYIYALGGASTNFSDLTRCGAEADPSSDGTLSPWEFTTPMIQSRGAF